MPGLFGVVSLDRGTPVTQSARATDAFERLAVSLVHHRFDVVERWQDPGGFMLVGRAGQHEHHHTPWPASPSSDQAWVRFVAGSLEQPSASAASVPEHADQRAGSLSALHGSYALLDCRPSTREALVATDRRASFPIVYLADGALLLFGPELEAILYARASGRDVDPAAAVSLLSQGHLLAGQTLQRGAHRLRGGEALIISDDRVRTQAYWRFEPGRSAPNANQEELEAALAVEVRASVARNLGDAHQTMVFLSGGVDSRAVAAAAAEQLPAGGDLNTVTWGVDESAGSDADTARQIAGILRSRHRFMHRTLDGYGRHFESTNRLIGSGADVAAFHPREASLMAALRDDGFDRVLRGDEAFGWSAAVANLDEAFREVKIRPLDDLPAVQSVIRRDLVDEWSGAARSALDAAGEEVRGWSPDAAKDSLYFNHRLQGYLSPAAYFKLCWVDHRNPLLDDGILDFMARVPDPLRVDKLLFRRAMARAYPDLWRVPIAQQSNLEEWPRVLAGDTPAREYLIRSLGKADTALWDVLDRARIEQLLDRVVGDRSGTSPRTRTPARSMRARALQRMPAGFRRRWTRYRGARRVIHTPPHVIVMRALVLQQFLDGVLSGPMELPPLEHARSAG
jgi:asparagine synthetase B (glutamine-hydrolysing)